MENLPPNQQPPPLQPAQPPVFITAPPQRRGGKGWMFLSFFLILLIGLVMFGGFASALIGGGKQSIGTQSGRHFEEITVENPGGRDKIAVIDVNGMITSEPWDPSGRSMVDVIEDQLYIASRDERVKAVILKVDSPGGEVLASDDISRALLEFQEKYKKPVIASMGGLAASGGYYVAAPCRWIVANDLTITGSIGVILSSFNYRGLMDKVGLAPIVYKSGKHKDMLRGSKRPEDIDPAEEQMVQDMIMETFAKFKSVVKSGRGRAAELNGGQGQTLVSDWEQYADGRILTGKTAYDLGFVDQLGNFRTALETTYRIAGLTEKAHVVRYQEPFTVARLLGFGMKAQTRDANVVKVDLGFDVPKVTPGRLYFLAPTMLQ